MTAILILAYHTLQEHLRNRSMLVAMLFSGVLIYMGILLGVLAVEQELRVLLDFGLGLIELMATALAVFGAATGVLREMETKTIYLVLTRPVHRMSFLLGRYLGLLLSAGCALAIMSSVHVSLLFLKGWHGEWTYPLAICGIFLKLALSTALALFLALLSTSVLSALTMTAIAWTLGHFIPEMEFLLRRLQGSFSYVLLSPMTYVLPNLQLFNFRDRMEVPMRLSPDAWHSSAPQAIGLPQWHGEAVWTALAYALVYAAASLSLAFAMLRRREL